jgi:hypothetical protein
MKRLPEKMIMATIILSCGFVMHSESSERTKVKYANGAGAHTWQMLRSAEPSGHQSRAAKTFVMRDIRASW